MRNRLERKHAESRARVGAARPSQLLYTYGVGAQVDLPNISVVVAGLDAWDNPPETIAERRLLRAVRGALGPQVERLAALPWKPETGSLFDEAHRLGVPVLPFPRWMRCTLCDMLAPFEQFQLKPDLWRPERTRVVHPNCPRMKRRPPLVIPARFVVACKRGHLDDFPWVGFVHRFKACPRGAPSLRMRDIGSGTRSTEILVECVACEMRNTMQHLFGRQEGRDAFLPRCRGRHVHLRRFEPAGCAEIAEPVLLGASNLWFAETRNAFALPLAQAGALDRLVDERWDELNLVTSADMLPLVIKLRPDLASLGHHPVPAVLEAIERRRNEPPEEEGPIDLKRPEWERFIDPVGTDPSDDFEVTARVVPPPLADTVAQVVAAERLREVVALIGFARIEAPDATGNDDDDPSQHRVSIANSGPYWVPAAEVRGEGIFIRLAEARVAAWCERVRESERVEALHASHRKRSGRPWPGVRYLLLHSLAHALINEVALDCGYSAASIRERVYASDEDSPMAGVLLYTAAPDAEGTLGGLVSLTETDALSRIFQGMLRRAEVCASDPLCAEHVPTESDASLHAAACHGCLLVPETSCEVGNRYLDRATLVETVVGSGIGYFTAR